MAKKEANLMDVTTAIAPLTQDELSTFKSIFGVDEQNKMVLAIVDKFNKALLTIGDKYEALISDVELLCREQKDREDKVVAAITQLSSSQDRVSNAITNASDMYRKVTFATKGSSSGNSPKQEAIKELSPLFYSVHNAENKLNWKEKVRGIISGQCLDNGRNKGNDYKSIYDGMMRDGYDVHKLLTEFNKYYPGATILDMCAESDALRYCIEKHVNNLYFSSLKNNYQSMLKKNDGTTNTDSTTNSDGTTNTDGACVPSTHHVSYNIANSCPPVISDIVKLMSGSSRPGGRAYSRAKKIINATSTITIDEMVNSTKHKYNLKSCNIWFAVANFPEVVDLLRKEAVRISANK